MRTLMISESELSELNASKDRGPTPPESEASEICRGCEWLDLEGDCERFRECPRFRVWSRRMWDSIRRLFGKGDGS